MFCKETLYSKIEEIHHRTIKVVHGIDDSYKNLLLSSNSMSIHQRYLRFLVTEIFTSISQINPVFMWSFIKPKKLSYSLRKGSILNLPRAQSTYYGANAIYFRGSLICSLVLLYVLICSYILYVLISYRFSCSLICSLPAKVKSSNSAFEFKTKIKNLRNTDCGCLICR